VLDGITLAVDRDVFPPDLGRCARNMARLGAEYAPRSALDVGCGSGFLALALKRTGAADVWATDIHGPAVECTRKNVARNRADVGTVHVAQGDLFESIPAGATFDLITFHQPYAPGEGEPLCGCGPDGGYEVTKRFLSTAPAYLSDRGAILMAFSDRAPAENDPKLVARELGYRVTTLLHRYYSASHNVVYELRPSGGVVERRGRAPAA
jgi:release factor glutamine methyltransferase